MANQIKFKRGDKADLPLLDCGEPAITLDTEEFYVGIKNKNIQLASSDYVDEQILKLIETGGTVPDNVLTEDDILNTVTVTEPGFALDARQANPDIVGTMANKISILTSSLGSIQIASLTVTYAGATVGQEVTIANSAYTITANFDTALSVTVPLYTWGNYTVSSGDATQVSLAVTANSFYYSVNLSDLPDSVYLFGTDTDSYTYWTDVSKESWPTKYGRAIITPKSIYLDNTNGTGSGAATRAYARRLLTGDTDFSKFKYVTVRGSFAGNDKIVIGFVSASGGFEMPWGTSKNGVKMLLTRSLQALTQVYIGCETTNNTVTEISLSETNIVNL